MFGKSVFSMQLRQSTTRHVIRFQAPNNFYDVAWMKPCGQLRVDLRQFAIERLRPISLGHCRKTMPIIPISRWSFP